MFKAGGDLYSHQKGKYVRAYYNESLSNDDNGYQVNLMFYNNQNEDDYFDEEFITTNSPEEAEKLADKINEKGYEKFMPKNKFAKGGMVKYVDTKYSQDSGGVPHFLRFPNAIGSFAWRFGKYNEGILYNLDEFDKDYYSHLRLKNGEKLFRYSTDKMIDGSKYLIKINLYKGLIYFMSEQNDMNDDKNILFETRGIKFEYIILDKDKVANIFEKYALGGKVDWDKYYELQTLKNEESILERRLMEVVDNQSDGWRIDKAEIESDLEMVREKINELENSYENGGGVNEEEISANRYLEVEELNRKINYLTQQIESDYRNNEIDNYTIRNEKELDRFKQKVEFLMYGRDAYADGGSVDKIKLKDSMSKHPRVL
jgi:hypothetical protein